MTPDHFQSLRQGLLATALAVALAPACAQQQAAAEPEPTTPAVAAAPAATATPATTPEPAAAAAPSPSPSPEEKKAQLKKSLIAAHSGREHIVSKEELTPLGTPEELTAALTELYADPAVPLAARVNMLASLRFFPSPTSKALYEKTLLASDTPDPARRAAVRAYGESFKEDSVPVLVKMLDHPELHTRNAAARTLGEIGTPPAKAALQKRLPAEKDAMVKATIRASLKK